MVGTGVAPLTAVVGSAVAVIAVVVTLTGDVRAGLREVRGRLDGFDARTVAGSFASFRARQDLPGQGHGPSQAAPGAAARLRCTATSRAAEADHCLLWAASPRVAL